jgi:hypothetical protein
MRLARGSPGLCSTRVPSHALDPKPPQAALTRRIPRVELSVYTSLESAQLVRHV